MNLLIVTQKVDKNDSILGFFHRWIEEFSKNTNKLTVICLEKGEYNLPENVKILSLGKESGRSKVKYLFNFYKYIWREQKNYDVIFVHMNQIYIILGGLFWRMMKNKIGLWYAHGSVSSSLKFSTKLSNYIFTSTESGFRLNSPKKNVVGQGIDTELFKPLDVLRENFILMVARISRVKNINQAFELLKKFPDLSLKIVGEPVTDEDLEYKRDLEKGIRRQALGDRVEFLGVKIGDDLNLLYNRCAFFFNPSQTGSMDKTVMEALATNTNVITSNKAFENVKFVNYFTDLSEITTETLNKDISRKREYVVENHSVDRLIKKILSIYQTS